MISSFIKLDNNVVTISMLYSSLVLLLLLRSKRENRTSTPRRRISFASPTTVRRGANARGKNCEQTSVRPRVHRFSIPGAMDRGPAYGLYGCITHARKSVIADEGGGGVTARRQNTKGSVKQARGAGGTKRTYHGQRPRRIFIWSAGDSTGAAFDRAHMSLSLYPAGKRQRERQTLLSLTSRGSEHCARMQGKQMRDCLG